MNVYLLGATGSIGTQVLEVVRTIDAKIISISAGKNINRVREIIEEFSPRYVSVLDETDKLVLEKEFPDVDFGFGEKWLIEAATYQNQDGVVVNAVVGMIGLRPTIEAIKKKRNILLANKETLVVAGEIITKLAKEYGVKLIPIDSEHSAILQCLNNNKIEEVKNIIITASGGTFRERSRDSLHDVTLQDVLKHPNWSMGAKITVDSATMVNKGLEVIEAHFLFGLDYSQIKTVLHYESIIHSMVEFKDNSVIAQLSVPDMRLPIQHAFTYPKKEINVLTPSIDFSSLGKLTFKEMDYNRFPMLELAYKVGKMGGILPTVYNASNEEAVNLFINGKIAFLDIEKIILDAVNQTKNILNPTISDIIETASSVREKIKKMYL